MHSARERKGGRERGTEKREEGTGKEREVDSVIRLPTCSRGFQHMGRSCRALLHAHFYIFLYIYSHILLLFLYSRVLAYRREIRESIEKERSGRAQLSLFRV